jgi:hypothetical protein
MALVGLALSIPVWWGGLFLSPEFRGWFVEPAHWPVLRSCLAPDMVLALFTAAAAPGPRPVEGGRSWRGGAAIGGWAYATAWTLSATSRGELRYTGAVMMLVALVLVTLLTHARVSSRPEGAR